MTDDTTGTAAPTAPTMNGMLAGSDTPIYAAPAAGGAAANDVENAPPLVPPPISGESLSDGDGAGFTAIAHPAGEPVTPETAYEAHRLAALADGDSTLPT